MTGKQSANSVINVCVKAEFFCANITSLTKGRTIMSPATANITIPDPVRIKPFPARCIPYHVGTRPGGSLHAERQLLRAMLGLRCRVRGRELAAMGVCVEGLEHNTK